MDSFSLPNTEIGALHILPVWLSLLLKLCILFLLAALFFKFIFPRMQKRLKETSHDSTPKTHNRNYVKSDIKKIQDKAYNDHNYRGALFELSAYIKKHLSKTSDLDFVILTAADISRKCSSRIHRDFFRDLENTVYAQNEVTRKMMNDLCRDAEKAARTKVEPR